MDHRKKIEAPDPVVKDLISGKIMNSGEKERLCFSKYWFINIVLSRKISFALLSFIKIYYFYTLVLSVLVFIFYFNVFFFIFLDTFTGVASHPIHLL